MFIKRQIIYFARSRFEVLRDVRTMDGRELEHRMCVPEKPQTVTARNIQHGFALLNVILGTMLLVGIIYLIMHAMTYFRSENKARDIGDTLVPVLAEVIIQSATKNAGTYSSLCDANNGLLKNISPAYLDGLKQSGFDLCAKATVVIT